MLRLHPPVTARTWLVSILSLTAWPVSLWATHPLITEDSATQGTGHWQWEATTEHTQTGTNGMTRYSAQTNNVLTWGATKTLDVIVTAPWLHLAASAQDGTPGESGFADAGLDIKWRFYESGPLSLAFKPGVTLPTGSPARGLGTGELSWSAYVISSVDIKPWMFLLHGGHQHHNNSFNERVDIWHVSAAVVYDASERLRLILDCGIDNNTNLNARSDPAFVIVGGIWSPRTDLDIDLGLRHTSSDVAHANALLAGLTLRW